MRSNSLLSQLGFLKGKNRTQRRSLFSTLFNFARRSYLRGSRTTHYERDERFWDFLLGVKPELRPVSLAVPIAAMAGLGIGAPMADAQLTDSVMFVQKKAFENPLSVLNFYGNHSYAYPVFADIDNDGQDEIIAPAYRDTTYGGRFLENVGGGFVVNSMNNSDAILLPGLNVYYGRALKVGDVDGDGDDDFIVFDRQPYSGYLYLNNGDSASRVGSVYDPNNPQIENSSFPLMANVDGDAELEVVTHGNRYYFGIGGNSMAVLENSGVDFVRPASSNGQDFISDLGGVRLGYGLRTNEYEVTRFGDFDGDGDLDAVYSAQDLYIRLNDGTGVFDDYGYAPRVSGISGGYRNSFPEVVDIDGDGQDELVLMDGDGVYGQQYGFGVLENTGVDFANEEYHNSTSYRGLMGIGLSAYDDSSSLGFFDIDNDGDLDAVQKASSGRGPFGEILIHYNYNDSQTAGGFSFAQGNELAYWVRAQVGVDISADLDGDGIDELVLIPENVYASHSNFPTGIINTGNDFATVFNTQEAYGAGQIYTYGMLVSEYDRLSLGDLDGDGDTDVLAVQYNGGAPAINLNLNDPLVTGAEGFSSFYLQVSGGGSIQYPDLLLLPILADLDSDGNAELITLGDTAGASLRVFDFNTSTNEFDERTGTNNPLRNVIPSSTSLDSYFGVAIGNLDADADLEVVAVDSNSNTFRFFDANGNGELVEITGTSNPFYGYYPAYSQALPQILDFNGDGNNDFVHGSHLFTGDGNSTFARSSTGLPYRGSQVFPTFHDFDGDGDMDAILDDYTYSGQLYGIRYFANQDGVFQEYSDARNPFLSLQLLTDSRLPYSSGPVVMDIDNDGDMDVLHTHYSYHLRPGMRAFKHGAEGLEELVGLDNPLRHIVPFEHYGHNLNYKIFYRVGLAFGDVDNDGDDDAVMFQPEYSGRGYTTAVRFFRNENGILLEQLQGDNPFAANSFDVVNYPGFKPVIADIDGDGQQDTLLPSGGSRFEVYLGSASIDPVSSDDFIARNNVGGGENPYSMPSLIDIDNDGDLDALTYYYSNYAYGRSQARIGVHENRYGTFYELGDNPNLFSAVGGLNYPDYLGGKGPLVADIDGDGDEDIITHRGSNNYGAPVLRSLVGDSSANMQPQYGIYNPLRNISIGSWNPYDENFMDVAFVDADLDGDLDAFVVDNTGYNSYGQYVRFLENKQFYDQKTSQYLSTFVPVSYASGNNPLGYVGAYKEPYVAGDTIGSADLDGDGVDELLINNRGDILTYAGDASGTMVPSLYVPNGGYGPQGIYTIPNFGNFDADADIEMLRYVASNAGNGTITEGRYGIGFYDNDGNGFYPVGDTRSNPFRNVIVSTTPFTNLLAADIDGDGDKDVMGHFNWYDEMQAPLMTHNFDGSDLRFAPGAENPLRNVIPSAGSGNTYSNGYFSAAFGDLDGDGDAECILIDQYAYTGGAGNVRVFDKTTDDKGRSVFVELPSPNDAYTTVPAGLMAHPFYGFTAGTDPVGGLRPIIADLDGDGLIDVALPSTADTFYLYSGDGTGGFSATAISFQAGISDYGPSTPTVADVDGDGDNDLVSVGYFTGSYGPSFPGGLTTLLFDENSGDFVNAESTPDGNPLAPFGKSGYGYQHQAPIAGDFDGDGDIDIIDFGYSRQESPIRVFDRIGGVLQEVPWHLNPLSNENVGAQIAYYASYSYTPTPIFGDLDGDNDLDAVFADNGGQQYSLENDGYGNFSLFGTDPLVAGGISMRLDGIYQGSTLPAFMDIDGDGVEELVNYNDSSYSFEYSGTRRVPVAVADNGRFITATGSSNPLRNVPESTHPFILLEPFDANGDGKLDLFQFDYGSTLTMKLFERDVSGFYVETIGTANPFDGVVFDSSRTCYVHDYNGDGKMDIIQFGTTAGTTDIYRNDSTTFPPATVFTKIDNTTIFDALFGINSFSPSTLVVGNFDGDANVDILTAGNVNAGDNYSVLFFEDDGGTFVLRTGSANPFDGVSADSITRIVAEDLTGNGLTDVILPRANGSGGPVLYKQTSAGVFALDSGFANGLQQYFRVFLDDSFGGDSDIDVIFTSRDANNRYHYVVLENDGAGNFTEVTTKDHRFHNAPIIADFINEQFMADITGDGLPDLIGDFRWGSLPLRVFAFDNSTWSELHGAANPFSQMRAVRDQQPTFGDVDNDGDLDAILTHFSTIGDEPTFFINDGTELNIVTDATGTPFEGLSGQSLELTEHTRLQDLDGNGYADFMQFQNTNPASVLTFMNSANGFELASGTLDPFRNFNKFVGNYGTSNLGWISMPNFGDSDGDGDLEATVIARDAGLPPAQRQYDHPQGQLFEAFAVSTTPVDDNADGVDDTWMVVNNFEPDTDVENDDDGDNIPLFAEYALGIDPNGQQDPSNYAPILGFDPGALPASAGGGSGGIELRPLASSGDSITFSYKRRIGLTGVTVDVEAVSTLEGGTPSFTSLTPGVDFTESISAIPGETEKELVTVTLTQPVGAVNSLFLRYNIVAPD